ncbi:MAG TPA: hypothetical protein VKE74_04545 [Gemmataceae bacterium]|nr:hypothetical protein [Gemmataceae bacterium]
MQTNAADREELLRLADDGCPNTPAEDTSDPFELWRDLGGSD